MKDKTRFVGIFSIVISVLLCFSSYLISKFTYDLTFWIHTNVLNKGNSIETEAAFTVAVVYVIVTYIAVVLSIASLIRLVYKKPLLECIQYQVYRYFAFFALLPLVEVGLSWENFRVFLPAKEDGHISLPTGFEPILDFASVFCGLILFLAVLAVIVSTAAFSYGTLVSSNVHLNRICGAIWLIYAYYVCSIVSSCFEYGKWMVLFVLVCYLITAVVFISYKAAKKKPLIPRYELIVLNIDNADDA